MSSTIKVGLAGVDNLLEKFATLKSAMQQAVLLRAARAGAAPILKRTKELAPRDTGALATRGITTAVTARKKNYAEVSVVPKKGFGYAIVQEYGAARHVIKTKSGKPFVHPGHRARPHFRPAFAEKVDDARDAATRVLKAEIFKAASK